MRGFLNELKSARVLGGPATPAVRCLISATVITYLVQNCDRLAGGSFTSTFGLVPVLVTHRWFVWQVLTHVFLHGPIFHIFLNMLTVHAVGTELERVWGSRRFLFYYALTGTGAGLLAIAVAPSESTVIVGASGAVYGLLLAYGVLFPRRVFNVWGLLPIGARAFALILGGLTFASACAHGGGEGMSNLAHLGGLVAGLVYLGLDRWLYRVTRGRVARSGSQQVHCAGLEFQRPQRSWQQIYYSMRTR